MCQINCHTVIIVKLKVVKHYKKMVINKENLSDLKENFEKALKYYEEDSKHDPVINPYKSFYAARDILLEMQNNIKNLLSSLNEDNIEDILIYKCILGYVYKDLGRNFIATEEFSEGEKYLKMVIDLLEDYKTCAEGVIVYMESLNELGILYSIRQEAIKSKEYLDKAEHLYNDYEKIGIDALQLIDIFGTKDEIEPGKGRIALELIHTLTMCYLAQILGLMKDMHNSAYYCHKTLKRQIQYNSYDAIDWGLNAASLSQYFFSNNRLTESRHHLAAANLILDKYEKETMIEPNMTEDQQGAKQEIFKHRYADLARCWAKYGLNLLSTSKERLMDDKDETDEKKDVSLQTSMLQLKISSEKFETLDVSEYENLVTDKYLLTMDDALPVFKFIEKWLNKAKEYYDSETEASEYAKIIQDLSSAHKYLAFFEENSSNQCKLHKRRADFLEELVKIYNPTYYMNICREVWYELGLTYSTMLDIKLDTLEAQSVSDRPTPHALNKINLLCHKSIGHFTAFLDSYRKKDTKEMPKGIISTDDLQPILFCYFYLGRLYYKIITPDKKMQLTNVSNSFKYYSLVVTTCTDNKETSGFFSAELGVCKEMVSLLPRKMQKLIDEIKS